MDILTILFVKRTGFNLSSMFIRWALPVSRFKWARASHSIIVCGDYAYQATAFHGVTKTLLKDALLKYTLVAKKDFEVLDINSGINWLENQVGKKYDFWGAIGLAIKPDRLWAEEDKWFCHEFCAAALQAAGRKLFIDTGYVTDNCLIIANPRLTNGSN